MGVLVVPSSGSNTQRKREGGRSPAIRRVPPPGCPWSGKRSARISRHIRSHAISISVTRSMRPFCRSGNPIPARVLDVAGLQNYFDGRGEVGGQAMLHSEWRVPMPVLIRHSTSALSRF